MVIGEIIAIVGVVSAFVTQWVALNLKIQKVQIEINNLKNEHAKDMRTVEKTFTALIERIERIEESNTTQHYQMLEKIDDIKKNISQIQITCAAKKNCI